MCNLCSEYLYVMLACCAVSCLKNVSAQSDSVLLCASDNKTLETWLLTDTPDLHLTYSYFNGL